MSDWGRRFYLRAREFHMRAQNGRCYWCGVRMRRYTTPTGVLPDDALTLDHLYSRLDPRRETALGRRAFVAACYKCNHGRGNAEHMALPLEEKHRRSVMGGAAA